METVKREFKEFATHKETAEYCARQCKYPTLMFAYWKGKKFRLNVLAWTVVKSTLKLNDLDLDENKRNNTENNISVSA
jgi:hypothetical protein